MALTDEYSHSCRRPCPRSIANRFNRGDSAVDVGERGEDVVVLVPGDDVCADAVLGQRSRDSRGKADSFETRVDLHDE